MNFLTNINDINIGDTLVICGHTLKRFCSVVFLVYNVVEPYR